ncbi:MAG: Crp/Fnr family transcriptional regulator [Scytonematopsis contorta HA4267-MV1]|jgi:CRP-like cAMP-binding protein|nr:Crp/Fnr family transcriptional regulator [Scytonematopsis contorta HA4267-MV1]
MLKDCRISMENRLLAALPKGEYERLIPHLEPFAIKAKEFLYTDNQPIEHVYFLQSGAASLLTRMDDNTFLEVATVGNEAMVGLPVFLGVHQISWQACLQIIPGSALRMRAEIFQREVPPTSSLHMLLQRYTQALFNQVTYLAACNRLHSTKQRCCRWLLGTYDRTGSEQLNLTQESLSQMLGVRRASVSEVAVFLQQAGMLRYSRGKMHILDRNGLEANSCECYGKIKREYDGLLGAYRNREPTEK